MQLSTSSRSSTMATAEERTAPAGSESSSVVHWGESSSSGRRVAAQERPPAAAAAARRSRPLRDPREFPLITCRSPGLQLQPKKPKTPAKNQVQESVPQRTMIASWDMADDVGYDQVKNVFQEVGEIVGIYFSSTRHLAVVDFSTEQAAENALYHLLGYDLMGRPLKLTWFDSKDFTFLRDMPSHGERMPNSFTNTVCYGL